MPFKLVPPRQGQSSNWRIRGTHLKVYVDRTSGTPKRSVARSIRDALERAVERGEYPPKEEAPAARAGALTFAEAALAYLKAGKRKRYIGKLVKHFGDTPISSIDQAAINAAADALCRPGTGGGGRNAAVYTPVAAILHHNGVAIQVKRPKGAKGRIVTDWLTIEDAALIIDAAYAIDAEFGLYLKLLLYTGPRRAEPLKWLRSDFRADERTIWTRRGKKGIASNVKLRPEHAEELAKHIAGHEREHIFRFRDGGHFAHMLTRAKLKALGLPCPTTRPTGWRPPANRFAWVTFHIFRHTWATWLRLYAGFDDIDLAATDNWRDPRSARRYMHALPRGQWDKVGLLPDIARKKA
ncbi:MAG TPA: tyrosine-type recombinase/integrase [Xanthobacteraceae bacterium]|nr:tyrosine-type recombinase/integrase [Xanthobacteraceae bacterium]